MPDDIRDDHDQQLRLFDRLKFGEIANVAGSNTGGVAAAPGSSSESKGP
jgi:hypothetical protein